MRRRSIVPLALAVALAVPLPAGAADLVPPREVMFEEVPIANQRGFYARFDANLAFPMSPNADRFGDESLSFVPGFEGGVGYQVNDYFRADATVGLQGRSDYGSRGACLGCAGGRPARFDAEVGAIPILANAYAGLPNSSIFTPYVGGGIGAAYVFTDGVSQSVAGRGRSGLGGRGQWNFAWQLSAGVSADVLPNASIDLGYRYLNVGQAHVGDGRGGSASIGTVQSHQVRLGVRMLLQ